MPPDRAERVAEIVERALESEPGERGVLVQELCGGDVDLQAEVESLLKFQDEARDFIEAPAYQSAASTLGVEPDGALQAGAMLGDYRISSLLGEGGMGEVYLAEDVSLGRKVAIKLLKFGLGGASFTRSFQQEERILAGLSHPNIAQLYGGAVTSSGLPYFVMEYVDGRRLDDYCRDRQLSIEQRLVLFRKICQAVAYAHQRLVIHRDIKPANIRMTSEGEPKLLDFGIAKLLDPTATAAESTMTLAAVMTPEYASPEQASGENITTASDVYSLGVVLYELLTGQKPFTIDKRTPGHVARMLAEREPPRPSTAVAKSAEKPDAAFRSAKSLRGDLDNIILKALRKEPERRYASVGQFSEDILRYQQGRTVVARKDTVAYRASKFIARNKVAVVATVVILLAIITGSIVSLRQAQNARRQRDVAQRERAKAEHTSRFLQEMLGAAAPEMKGVDVKVTDVLGEASRRARSEIADQPEVMADVLMTLGRTYISLSLYKQAEEDLRLAVDTSLKANGERHSTTATSMGWLGLALAYKDKWPEAEPVARRAVELQRELHPEGNADLGVAQYCLAMCLISKGEVQSAEQALQEAVDLIGKFLGPKHGYHLATLTGLAMAKERLGKIDQAESLYREAIAVGHGVEQRYRIFLAQAQASFGIMLTNKNAYAEAERELRESEALYEQLMGEHNANVGVLQTNLGRLYFQQGDYVRAEIEYRKAVQTLPQFFPLEHKLPVGAKGALGLTLTRLGNPAEGEPLLQEALELRKKTLPPDNLMIPFTESALGECLLAQKRYADAETTLLSGYQGLQAKLGNEESRVIEARQRLAQLYDEWGKSDVAASYR